MGSIESAGKLCLNLSAATCACDEYEYGVYFDKTNFKKRQQKTKWVIIVVVKKKTCKNTLSIWSKVKL